MNVYAQTTITVTSPTAFTTGIDTSWQRPFISPTFVDGGKGFTQAQVVPITGVEENIL
jgi:hypothetical protein